MTRQNVPYESLDTPLILLDLDKVEVNIAEVTNLIADAGIKWRPHVKMHENATLTKMAVETGASGIEVGNIDQAEIMAKEGFDDILIAHPFYGEQKLKKLDRLIGNTKLKLSVVVDMVEQAEEISHVAQSIGKRIPVLLKIDAGVGRYGVKPGEPTRAIANKLCQMSGINFIGIYTHDGWAVPDDEGVAKVALESGSIMAETARMLRGAGYKLNDVAVGSSASFRAFCRYIKEGLFKEITEIHPGGCVVGDIKYVTTHGTRKSDCAITVLTTVVSTSHTNHAIIDAGFKTFGIDSLIERRSTPDFFWEEKPSFGFITERPDLWLGHLSAECGWVFYKNPAAKSLQVGDRLEIIPNNATLVFNLHDRVYGVRKGAVEKVVPITARGSGS